MKPPSAPDDQQARSTDVTSYIVPVNAADAGRSTTNLLGAAVETSCDEITLPLPQRIGRFEVRGFLGAGAFGWVYRAFDPTLRRDVAIKVLRADRVGGPAERERLLKEARAAATVRHPQIVPVYEVGEDDGGPPFIVMGLLAGVSLSAGLAARSGPFSPIEAANIVRGLAKAVAAAHAKGIIHRDLKPANILHDNETGDYVITDFGLARVTDPGDPTGSHNGFVGSPAYMSPEQARGDAAAVGPASDVHALGAILYELLTRELPYPGKVVVEVIHKVTTAPVLDPTEKNPTVPPELAAVCRKAMAKNLADRYATAREFADALTPFEVPPAGFRPVPEPAPVRQNRSRRTRVAVGLFALVAVVAAVVAGIVFYTRSNSATVRVELDVDPTDPALTFTLDGTPVERERLTKPMELPIGDHELVVTKAGKPIRRYGVSVIRGKLAAGITVLEREPGPAAEPPKPKPAPQEPEDVRSGAYDARVADELTKFGAKIAYTVGEDPTPNPLKAGEKLPSGARIVYLQFHGHPTGPTDEHMKLVAGLSRLQNLQIHDPEKVTDAGIKHLTGLSSLRYLGLFGVPVTDEGFQSVGKLTGLEHLNCMDLAVGDAGLKHLAGLTELKHLNVTGHGGPGRATGSFLAHLKGLTKLEGLNLANQPLRDEFLVHLKAFPNLLHLDLFGTAVTDDGLLHLRGLRLETLSLCNNPKITDRGMKVVAELVRLDNLNLNHTVVGDEGAKLIATLPRLKYLAIGQTKLTAAGVKYLTNAQALVDLELSALPVSEANLEGFAFLPELDALRLNKTPVTGRGLAHLARAPKLRYLGLFEAAVSDADVKFLAELKNVRSMELDGSKVTATGLRELKKSLPKCEISPPIPGE